MHLPRRGGNPSGSCSVGKGLCLTGKSKAVECAFSYSGVVSSAGRASALQAEGRRFDPVTTHHLPLDNHYRGPVVQLVRMPACHAGGRGFESRPVRHLSQWFICEQPTEFTHLGHRMTNYPGFQDRGQFFPSYSERRDIRRSFTFSNMALRFHSKPDANSGPISLEKLSSWSLAAMFSSNCLLVT